MNIVLIISFTADILAIISCLSNWGFGKNIPLPLLTFLLGVLLASAAFLWLPYFKRQRLLKRYRQQKAAQRLRHLLKNQEFMKQFHYEKSPRSNTSMLCDASGNWICPECADNNIMSILPSNRPNDMSVVCPRCGHVVNL